MRRERYEKTVRVPVRVQQGRIEFLYEAQMPALREGAVGELVFDAGALEDARWKAPLNAERTVTIIDEEALAAGAWAALAVKPDQVPAALRTHLVSLREWLVLVDGTLEPDEAARLDLNAPVEMRARYWVSARLTAPLSLRLRGERSSRLQGGACHIPVLAALNRPADAISLNQALTWISTCFEPLRQSHTGNTFRDVLLQWEGNFDSLDDVRQTLEDTNEIRRLRAAGVDVQAVRQRALGGLFE